MDPGLLYVLHDPGDVDVGPVGESVVSKHYTKARGEVERGAGFEAVEEAVTQIARAASILKGPSTTEAILEQLKSLRA